MDELLSNLAGLPESNRTAVRNNGGGHANHSLFWTLMSPDGGGEPEGEPAEAITRSFGSFGQFQELFNAAAGSRFGSGWAWLSMSRFGKLVVHSTANQDNPVIDGLRPIVGLDVWEHAYYLKYQNRRPDYVGAWWKVVNWKQAGANFQSLV